VWCQYPPSEAVEGVVAALEEPRQVVARLQAAASVACPIAVDLRLSGAYALVGRLEPGQAGAMLWVCGLRWWVEVHCQACR